MEIRDSVTMITGGAGGPGSAARMLVAGGGRVALLDRLDAEGKDLAGSLGDRAIDAATRLA